MALISEKELKIIKAFFLLFFTAIILLYFFGERSIINYPSKGTDIIAFGDSLIEGVGSTGEGNFVSLLSQRIHYPIINLGHAGDTTVDGIARLNELDRYNPKVVLLLFGGNDYLKSIPTEETKKNLSILIKNIQSRGAVVVLLGVRGGLFYDNFNQMFRELQYTYHTAFVSDVLGGLYGNKSLTSDVVHPNNRGYKIISDRVYPILKEVI